MKDSECIFCGITSSQIVIDESGYRCQKCPNCNLIHLINKPSPEQIEKLYNKNFRSKKSANLSIIGFKSHRLYASHHLKLIQSYIKSGSLLEIGPGEGAFLYEAKIKGFEVSGIELNVIQANFIKNRLGIPCETSPLNAFSFGEKKFDIIYHRNVISHFLDPISEFHKMNGKLKDGGFVIFETGNLGDVELKYFDLYLEFQLPHHLYFFSDKSLKELFRRTGFKFVNVYRYSSLPLLKIIKILKIKKRQLAQKVSKPHQLASNRSEKGVNSLSFQYLSRNVFNFISFLLLYKIGYLVPNKKGKPQSVIIVTQKQ